MNRLRGRAQRTLPEPQTSPVSEGCGFIDRIHVAHSVSLSGVRLHGLRLLSAGFVRRRKRTGGVQSALRNLRRALHLRESRHFVALPSLHSSSASSLRCSHRHLSPQELPFSLFGGWNVGNYPILPYRFPDTPSIPFAEVFLRVLTVHGIVCLGVISKASGLSIRFARIGSLTDSIAFPRPDLQICPGDVLLCLRVNLRSCKNGDFIWLVCSIKHQNTFSPLVSM